MGRLSSSTPGGPTSTSVILKLKSLERERMVAGGGGDSQGHLSPFKASLLPQRSQGGTPALGLRRSQGPRCPSASVRPVACYRLCSPDFSSRREGHSTEPPGLHMSGQAGLVGMGKGEAGPGFLLQSQAPSEGPGSRCAPRGDSSSQWEAQREGC